MNIEEILREVAERVHKGYLKVRSNTNEVITVYLMYSNLFNLVVYGFLMDERLDKELEGDKDKVIETLDKLILLDNVASEEGKRVIGKALDVVKEEDIQEYVLLRIEGDEIPFISLEESLKNIKEEKYELFDGIFQRKYSYPLDVSFLVYSKKREGIVSIPNAKLMIYEIKDKEDIERLLKEKQDKYLNLKQNYGELANIIESKLYANV